MGCLSEESHLHLSKILDKWVREHVKDLGGVVRIKIETMPEYKKIHIIFYSCQITESARSLIRRFVSDSFKQQVIDVLPWKQVRLRGYPRERFDDHCRWTFEQKRAK